MPSKSRSKKIPLFEIILFALLGVIMLISKLLMEFLPNIHLLGMLTVTYTIVFRAKALIPIYIYVFLNGLIAGFSLWWIPYLYVWALLWGITMLIPDFKVPAVKAFFYTAVCALHGFLFGTLYAPMQAIMFDLSFKQIIAWIITGLPFDIIHGIGNILVGLLIYPLSLVLKRAVKH